MNKDSQQSVNAQQEETSVRLRVKVHGLLTAALKDPDGWLDLSSPKNTSIAGLIEFLSERQNSPLFDAGACMATIEGEAVPLDRILKNGDEVHLYHVFSGG
jgi:sulfur carrier protein ThiS